MNAQLHGAHIQYKLSYGLNYCENIESERKGYLFEIQLSIYSSSNYTSQQQVQAVKKLVKRITKCRKFRRLQGLVISSKGKISSKMIIFSSTVDTSEFFFAEKDRVKIKRIVLQIGGKMFPNHRVGSFHCSLSSTYGSRKTAQFYFYIGNCFNCIDKKFWRREWLTCHLGQELRPDLIRSELFLSTTEENEINGIRMQLYTKISSE